MASRTENAFEVLSRDEAAPEVEKPAVQVTQEDVEKGTARAEAKGAVLAPTGSPSPPAALADAPPTPGRTGRAAEVHPDLSKAPGAISYAQAVSEPAEAAESHASKSAEATKEAAGEAKEAAKAKAGELKERAAGAAEEAKERASAAGQAISERAGEVAESAKHAAGEAAQRAEELAGAAKERASEAAEAAKEKVSSAVEYLKEHVPKVHVERAETTPEERESQAAIDEALALATGEPAPIRREAPTTPSRPVAEPSSATSTAPATTSAGPSPGLAAAVEEPTAREAGTYRAYPPKTATEVANRASDLADEARHKASDLVHGAGKAAGDAVEGTKEAASSAKEAAKQAAPDELAARAEREEQSAKGPLEALADAVKGAAGYVRQHVLHGGSPRPGSPSAAAAREGAGQSPEAVRVEAGARHGGRVPHPHEWAALPGDIHPAQLAKAVREKILHVEEAPPSAEEVKGSTLGAMRDAGKEMEGGARAAADTVSGAAERAKETASEAAESVRGAAGEVANKAEGAYQQAREAVGEAASKAGDKAGEAKEAVKAKADEAGAAVQGAATRAGDKAEEAKDAAADKAQGAKESTDAAGEHASGLLGAARERVADAAHAVGDTVQAAEDKAKWAYQHTKEELKAGQEHWREATVPHTQEEALKAAGMVPTDTESLLRAQGQVVGDEENLAAAAVGAHHETAGEKLHHASDAAKESYKEAVHSLERKSFGEEGEVPS